MSIPVWSTQHSLFYKGPPTRAARNKINTNNSSSTQIIVLHGSKQLHVESYPVLVLV
ncbi:hypothetical protein HanRHA438_Chr10g0437791 [Helianthus annuus]|nr:hypothetical protein HanRHA438_Chr10g0437791 [Helianthus annuus]